LIGQQKHEIEVLKQGFEEGKYSKEVRMNEEARAKAEELAVLKTKEKEYLQSLS
jgi:hypothetical protein